MKLFIVSTIAVLCTLLALGVSPAQAASADPMTPFHGSLDGVVVGVVVDPGAVEARCGDGWQLILQTAGSGEISGIGGVTYTTEHCARVFTLTGRGAIFKLGLGVLTISTAGGDLDFAYEGTVPFEGNVETLEGVSVGAQRYVVVGGTGDFEGAAGHGIGRTAFASGVLHIDIDGSLLIDG